MFTKKISLKQHTPIIHFQHEMDGATLRATELKPKLDRFIVEDLSKVDMTLFDKYKHLIIEDNFPINGIAVASPYKIRINSQKLNEYVFTSLRDKDINRTFSNIGIGNAPYFADNKNIKDGTTENKGNDGQILKLKKGVISDNITLEIMSFDEEMVAFISEIIPYVLTYENFGTRQNKGFGSFHVEGKTSNDFKALLKKHPKYNKALCYTINANHNTYENFKAIFKVINDKYTVLKTGKTFPKTIMSKLLSWFIPKNMDWEKKIVRQYVVLNKDKKDFSEDNKFKYIRALLGLAEEYVYPFDKENGKETKVKIECIDKDISRFKSPLTFKVFENTIFVLVNDIEDDIFDATFEFYIKDNRKVTIKTPPKYINGKEVFNLKDFLEKHMNNDWKYE